MLIKKGHMSYKLTAQVQMVNIAERLSESKFFS